MVLVVGSQGMVGQAICACLAQKGRRVLTASHRPGADLLINLAGEPTPLDAACLDGVRHAVICSAVTSRKMCVEDPAARLFNVDHTISLIRNLIDLNIIPVFISSDAVFPDRAQPYGEDEPRHPESAYGEHKAAVERFLQDQVAPFIIIRLSKVFRTDAADRSVVAEWRAALRAGREISAAHDQTITPTAAEDVAEAVCRLMEQDRQGTYHVAADQHMTRLEFAKLLAQESGREDLVHSCSITEVDFVEPLPKTVLLDSAKLTRETGYRPRPFSAIWAEMMREGGRV